MQDEELMVDVMTNTHSDCMTETDGIIAAMKSVKNYPSEKVGADGLLELDFTVEDYYLTDAENNPVRFNIQVSKKVKDPIDNKKEIYLFVEDQMMQVLSNVEIVRSQDMKTLGIKAKKEDGTPFTKEEKIELRKRSICYKNTALMVEKSTLTPEAVENCAVIVEVDEMAEIEKTNSTCACKEYDLIWGAKVSCEFRKKVVEICKDLWPNDFKEMANNLMAVMAWESGESFSPSVKNPNSTATGLIQFMADTAIGLGTTTDKLAKMTAVEQLDYVKKYFEPQRNKKLEFVDFYLQVLYPASMGKPDNHVVFSKDGTGLDNNDKNYKSRIRAYSVNSGFDTNPLYGNNDGMVTVAEIKKGIQKYIDKGKINKALISICKDLNLNLSGKWHHPVEKPQLRGWYSIWAPERSVHSDNIIGRSKGKHDGLDFYAPTGTKLFACVDGEVNEIYYSESYGNTINIKGEYNGKTFWFFYAHLSETFITAKDKNGDPTKVKAGDPIGKSGKTGSSASSLKDNQVHLHFEVRTTSQRTGGRINPFDNIKELDSEVIKNPIQEEQP